MSKPASREETLFVEALARPEDQRQAFVSSACLNDPDLRARVLALLAAHASADTLAPPAFALPAALETPPGTRPPRKTKRRA